MWGVCCAADGEDVCASAGVVRGVDVPLPLDDVCGQCAHPEGRPTGLWVGPHATVHHPGCILHPLRHKQRHQSHHLQLHGRAIQVRQKPFS